MTINLEQLLIEAEKLCLQLKEVRHLPDEVKEILTGKPVEKNEKRHFPGIVAMVTVIVMWWSYDTGGNSCDECGSGVDGQLTVVR